MRKATGYTDGIPRHMSLQECAKELGVTPERVRQIEKSALAKLRKALSDRARPVLSGDIVPDNFTWMKA